METKVSFKSVKRIVLAVICAIVLITLALSSFSIVPEGYTGNVYRFGELVSTDTGTGLRVHAPFIESIQRIDMRAQVYELDMSCYTKDTQVIESLPVKLTYQYDRAKLDYLIRNVGIKNVESTLIAPNVPSVTKNFVSKYKGEETTQNRPTIEADVEEALRNELVDKGITVMDFNILDVDFEDSFEENIRQKVAAEVAAQTTKNNTARLEEEAHQKVIAAQADADAAKLKADADAYAIQVMQEQLQNSPQYVELIKAQKWDGVLPQVMGNTVNPFTSINGGGTNNE